MFVAVVVVVVVVVIGVIVVVLQKVQWCRSDGVRYTRCGIR